MNSVSRDNGGIFEAERRLQPTLHTEAEVEVEVLSPRDSNTAADLDTWKPLVPRTFPIVGPEVFDFAPGFARALYETGADLAYMAGLWKYPSLVLHRWSGRTGKPVVIAPHGMLDPWALRNSGWKKNIAKMLFQNAQLQKASCLRAVSLSEAESIRGYGLKNPICVISYGIDVPEVGAKAGHPKIPRDRKVLLFLGRIHPKKGLVNLLDAWGEFQKRDKNWRLVLAGWDQGGHEAELKKQATALGISWSDQTLEQAVASDSSLLFMGPQFGSDKTACYETCDAFILPSFSEGLPMAMLEAWAHGKPGLITPHCNIPEGFAAGAAIRVEPTAASLGEGLRELASMSGADLQTMGGRGRKLVLNRFSWPELAREMKRVYEWVLGGGPRPGCVMS
jgi:glycosyltransferase involved in cell wall biosynthesis